MPCSRGDAFGMELDAVDGRLRVPHGHYGSILAPGVGDQRRLRVGNRQRMIAGRREGRGKAGEQAASVMADLRRPSHGPDGCVRRAIRRPARSPDDPGKRRAADGAVRCSATPARRKSPRPRAHRDRGYEDSVAADAKACSTRHGVIPLDLHLRAERHEIIDQHEGEAVDIVDDEDLGLGHGRRMTGPLVAGPGDPLPATPRSPPRCA